MKISHILVKEDRNRIEYACDQPYTTSDRYEFVRNKWLTNKDKEKSKFANCKKMI